MPASLNQPFWIPTSNAVQPGQSLYATRNGSFAGAAAGSGAGAGAAGAGAVGSGAGAGSAGLSPPQPRNNPRTNTLERRKPALLIIMASPRQATRCEPLRTWDQRSIEPFPPC